MIAKTFKALCLSAVASAVFLTAAGPAQAFWGHRRVTTAYALPTVPVTVASPVVVGRPVVAAPIVTAPVVTASPRMTAAPVVSAPVITGYAPAPVTTYYAPAAPVAAPVTTFYAPAGVVGPPIGGPVTTTLYAPAVAAPVIVRRPIFWP
jgi:hypothetical protein